MCGGGGEEVHVRPVDTIWEWALSLLPLWVLGIAGVPQLSQLTSRPLTFYRGLKGQCLSVRSVMNPPLLGVRTSQLTLPIVFRTKEAENSVCISFIDTQERLVFAEK